MAPEGPSQSWNHHALLPASLEPRRSSQGAPYKTYALRAASTDPATKPPRMTPLSTTSIFRSCARDDHVIFGSPFTCHIAGRESDMFTSNTDRWLSTILVHVHVCVLEYAHTRLHSVQQSKEHCVVRALQLEQWQWRLHWSEVLQLLLKLTFANL